MPKSINVVYIDSIIEFYLVLPLLVVMIA